MKAAVESATCLTSSTDSGFFAQSICTLKNVLQRHRTTTRTNGSSWRLSTQCNHGDTSSRAPTTRSWSNETIRISSSSKIPKCSPEDMPGGRISYSLKTLSWTTGKERRTRQIDRQEASTTRYTMRDGLGDYWQHWQLPALNCTRTSFMKSRQARLLTCWLPMWKTGLSAFQSSISLTCKEQTK